MGGLRVKAGVDLDRAEQKSRYSWRDGIDAQRLQVLVEQGWLSLERNHLSPSREGWLRVDSILPYILKAP